MEFGGNIRDPGGIDSRAKVNGGRQEACLEHDPCLLPARPILWILGVTCKQEQCNRPTTDNSHLDHWARPNLLVNGLCLSLGLLSLEYLQLLSSLRELR
jgi:hypothetical protein